MDYARDDSTRASPAVHSVARLSSPEYFIRLSDHVKQKCYRNPIVYRTVGGLTVRLQYQNEARKLGA